MFHRDFCVLYCAIKAITKIFTKREGGGFTILYMKNSVFEFGSETRIQGNFRIYSLYNLSMISASLVWETFCPQHHDIKV